MASVMAFTNPASAAAAANSGTSLIDIARHRVIEDMIETVKLRTSQSGDIEKAEEGGDTSVIEKQYMALIVDSHTLRVLSGACRQYDIQERGVTVVEQIEKPRQPLNDMDAIYFLTPTEASVDMLIRDHSSGGLYRYSHIFFAGSLNDKLFDTLAKEEGVVNRCYSMYELNLDYVCFEPRVFYCDQPLTIRNLRGNDANVMTGLIRRHVDCITSVCAGMKEKPVIRYMARSTVSNLSEKVALGFKREIDSLSASMERMHKPFRANGTTFLIVDRSIESAGLLLHDFFYQGCALDVLDGAEPTGVRWFLGGLPDVMLGGEKAPKEGVMSVVPSFDYQAVNGKGDTELKHAVLSEADDLWVKFRHAHVRDVGDITSKEIREFSKTHDLARLQREGRRASDADPMDLLRALPEYQDLLSKYAVHIELTKQCFDSIERLKLMDVAKIEQELATGVDDEGKETVCIKVYQALTTILQAGKISGEEKLRLIALYLSQVNDVTESSAQTLVRTAAALSPEYESAVKSFMGLGIHGTRSAVGGAPMATSSTPRHSHKLASDKNAIKKNKARAKASTYVNCRFVPRLKDLVESALLNNLDGSEFPTVAGTASGNGYTVGMSSATSPTAQGKSSAMMWAQDKDHSAASSVKQKIVVFVIGGITLNETRAMAELESQYNCEVIVGGSTILTPKRLVEILVAPVPLL
jgi:syntaxin-binding protein 1